MIIFHTSRLTVKQLTIKDKSYFRELLSDPEVITLVPQKPLTEYEIEQRFTVFTQYGYNPIHSDKTIWGIFEKGKDELIGLCALLTNDDGDRELGYRFRTPYWNKGYGTEHLQGLLEYCFTVLNLNKITADVNIANRGSVRILEKFMYLKGTFRNAVDDCTDSRYELTKVEWLTTQKKTLV